MNKSPTWNDFQEAKPADLKKTYRLTDRELERAYRRHIDGADADIRRQQYENLYRRNRSDA